MIHQAVISANRVVQSGCSVCGMRNHQAARCFCADKDGRLDLRKVAERKAPWSVLGHARKSGSLSTLSEEAFAQRKSKLEEILSQLDKANSKAKGKGKGETKVMKAELAVLQEAYQQTADRLASTQAELASVRQAHIAPSPNPIAKPSIPGHVSRVTALDNSSHVRQVRIMEPDPLCRTEESYRVSRCMLAEESSSTTPLQVILSETPADTSGVPGISLPPLQDAEVEHNGNVLLSGSNELIGEKLVPVQYWTNLDIIVPFLKLKRREGVLPIDCCIFRNNIDHAIQYFDHSGRMSSVVSRSELTSQGDRQSSSSPINTILRCIWGVCNTGYCDSGQFSAL